MSGREAVSGPSRLAAWRPHLAPALAILAVVGVLFWPVLFAGRVFYHRDIHLQWQPQMEAFVHTVAAGSWPLWDPASAFGQPLFANPNNQLLYPSTWLNLLLPAWACYAVLVVFHFGFAGIGMYLLALRHRVSRAGALLAAVMWIAGGPFFSLVDLWNHLCGAAWIPWSALAAARAFSDRRLIFSCVWGVTLAAPILAGSPETALMAIAGGVFLGPAAVAEGKPLSHRVREVMRVCGIAGIFALVLSAGQWVPSLELVLGSTRATPGFRGGAWSIHPITLLETLFPLFLDRLPLHWEVRGALYAFREPFLSSCYLGLGASGLVVAALSRPAKGLRLLLAAIFGASVVLSLGHHTPLYGIALALVPPLQALRFPAKFMIMAGFAWALLAGIGFDEWRAMQARIQRRVALCWLALVVVIGACMAAVFAYGAEDWGSALLFRGESRRSFGEILRPTGEHVAIASLFGFGLLLVGLLVGRRPRSRPLVAAMVVLAAGDLLVLHSHPTAERALFEYQPAAIQALRSPARQRVFAYDYFSPGKSWQHLGHRAAYLTRVPEEHWPFPWYDALALRGALYPSVLGCWGVEAGFSVDRLGLFPTQLQSFTSLLSRAEGNPAHLRLLQLGAVGSVVALHDDGFESLSLEHVYPTLMVEPLRLFRVPDPLPRAYAVDGVRVADGEAAILTLIDPAFDPRRELVLSAGSARPPSPGFAGSVAVRALAPDTVLLEADLPSPGYVVLVDGFDPGWRATLDGEPATVLRANAVFRAVAVPAGRHSIEYRYRPRSVLIGLAVSLAGVLAMAALALRHWKGR